MVTHVYVGVAWDNGPNSKYQDTESYKREKKRPLARALVFDYSVASERVIV